MTPDLVAAVPKRRAIDMSTRIEITDAFRLDSRLALSLPAIVAGLAGATAIVYVSIRFGSHHRRQVEAATGRETIETTGVTLVK